MAARLLEGEGRGQKAERRGRARGRRDQHLADAEDARDARRMGRACAAEADHGVAARILALLHDMDARGGGHALGDRAMDAGGRLERGQSELRADGGEGAFGRIAVERHAAAEEEARIVIAEHQIGVGHGRLAAAAAIAGRARIGARRMRADAQKPDLVDRRDRAAAGADLDHVDHRRLDRQARALLEAVHARRFHLGRDGGMSVLDQAGLGRGAAHVERNHIPLAGKLAEEGRGEAAARRARFEETDREGARGLGRNEAAGRMHQPQRAAEAALPQLALEAAHIEVHQRLHEGIGAGGDEALILAELGHHLARQRHGDLGIERADRLARRPLMRRVAVGVQEADGDRLDPIGLEPARGPAHRLEIERQRRCCRHGPCAPAPRGGGGAARAARGI